MARSSDLRKFAILSAILIVPAVAYLYLNTGKTHFKVPPVLGPKEISDKNVNGNSIGDTIYHTVPDITMLTQDSVVLNTADLKDKIKVYQLFYSRCTQGCETSTAQVMKVQHEFADDKKVNLISLTVDPASETPWVLKKYAKAHDATPGKWFFLCGNDTALGLIAQKGLFLSYSQPKEKKVIIHSHNLVLVDAKQHIRGYYDGTDYTETKKLIEDIKMLELEESSSDLVSH